MVCFDEKRLENMFLGQHFWGWTLNFPTSFWQNISQWRLWSGHYIAGIIVSFCTLVLPLACLLKVQNLGRRYTPHSDISGQNFAYR